jgi:hypothetical protein
MPYEAIVPWRIPALAAVYCLNLARAKGSRFSHITISRPKSAGIRRTVLAPL